MQKNINVVVFVLNNFMNDSRVLKEAITLHKNGCHVTVVALHEEPLAEHEIINDIKIHRISLRSRLWPKYRLVQIFKYLEFVYRSIKKYRKADIFHCNDLNTLPIGVIIKCLFNRKTKIVYDAHEYETETNGLHGIEKDIKIWLECVLIKYADKVMIFADLYKKELSM